MPVCLILCWLVSFLASGQSLGGMIVVVDAGHGGIDSGANRPGAVEKQINLAVALLVKDYLKEYGAKVILTRDTDVELSELCDNEKVKGRYRRDLNARLEMVEESDADLFVSIHANASANAGRKGIECYYAGSSETGRRLAVAIQEELRSVVPLSQVAKPADFFVLRRNKVPAALVEVGYITNAKELKLLQTPEYQRKLAAAIAAGISRYCRTATSLFSWLPHSGENLQDKK